MPYRLIIQHNNEIITMITIRKMMIMMTMMLKMMMVMENNSLASPEAAISFKCYSDFIFVVSAYEGGWPLVFLTVGPISYTRPKTSRRYG